MHYNDTHAEQAIRIFKENMPKAKRKPEYMKLMSIAETPKNWGAAHDCFTLIRTNITIPYETNGALPIDRSFSIVAELVCKTLYNCSGESAPFDNDSFDKLLDAENTLLAIESDLNSIDNFGLGTGSTPKSLAGATAQIILGWFKPKG
jgi:hypothetical protein